MTEDPAEATTGPSGPTTEEARPVRIAIACQGGGSHTAFTAGVLTRLLRPDVLEGRQVVGLSGTSGGAVCALLAWVAIRNGEPERAGELLDRFWKENAATALPERFLNAWMMWALEVSQYVGSASVSPYHTPASVLALQHFRSLLERSVDFDQLAQPAGPLTDDPLLLLGAVDVLSGSFKAFDSRKGEISADAVLASAAIPHLFRAVTVDGRLYWDGLFSQNPPVRNLLESGPDEIWVIQINPTELAQEPTTTVQIEDRRNELSGNLSLHQELSYIERIDRMLDAGDLAPGRYRPVTVRVLEMERTELSARLGPASKLNRDPDYLADLVAAGGQAADEFVTALTLEAAWQARDADALVGLFAPDARIEVEEPFEPWSPTGGPARERPAARATSDVEGFIRDRICTDLTVDLTHKHLSRRWARWKVRATQGLAQFEGRATVDIRDGKVVLFRLGPAD